MIITKRADQLKPGDIIVKKTAPRHVVINTYRANKLVVSVYSIELGTQPPVVLTKPPAMPYDNGTTFDVEVPDPKVSEADLATLIYAARTWLDGTPPAIADRKNLGDLVNKLSPPEPPTYEELLAALSNVVEVGAGHVSARDIIDRARAAGVLK